MTALAATTTASPAEVWTFVVVLVLALVVGIWLRVLERRERDGEGDR